MLTHLSWGSVIQEGSADELAKNWGTYLLAFSGRSRKVIVIGDFYSSWMLCDLGLWWYVPLYWTLSSLMRSPQMSPFPYVPPWKKKKISNSISKALKAAPSICGTGTIHTILHNCLLESAAYQEPSNVFVTWLGTVFHSTVPGPQGNAGEALSKYLLDYLSL